MTNDQNVIVELLRTYEAALNASDTKAATAIYAADGVFMPSGAPTAAGISAIKASYNYIFSQIRLDIRFEIHSVEVSGNMAFAHTSSAGHVTVLATGDTMPESNRELFVFQREGKDWKVSLYMFNKAA